MLVKILFLQVIKIVCKPMVREKTLHTGLWICFGDKYIELKKNTIMLTSVTVILLDNLQIVYDVLLF